MSAFLPLGLFGQGAFGIMQLAKVGQRVFAEQSFAHSSASGEIVFIVSMVVGLMLWGLGCWWFFHGASSVSGAFVSLLASIMPPSAPQHGSLHALMHRTLLVS